MIAPERPPSQTPAKLELVIFVGLQASGKTAFYRERFAESHAHVSKDNFPNHPRPQRRQMALLRETLAAGRSAVVDNTNPSAEIREPLIKLGREFGARIVGYGFESDLRACLERNARREGKARVPEIGLRAVSSQLETPRWEEGFDEIYCVRFAESGKFIIQRQNKYEK